jgi:hypothetical protein
MAPPSRCGDWPSACSRARVGALPRELCDDEEAKDPICAFVEGLLQACETPAARVVLEYVVGAGLKGVVSVRRLGGESAFPCDVPRRPSPGPAGRIPRVYVAPNVFSDDGACPAATPRAMAGASEAG